MVGAEVSRVIDSPSSRRTDVDERIASAALELLRSRGPAGVSVESVAAASGVAGGSLLLIPLACSLFGIPSEIAMQVVAVGFIIGVLQDSAETALNSSTDVLFTAAACLGVLYVLEGATLGGQILRREIAARLSLDADNGAAFLDIYGAATGRRWRDFIEYLGSRPMDADAREAVVAAAHPTFSCFERWLESREVLA